MIGLTLYTTAGCHLCELAQQVLETVSTNYDIDVSTVDIAEHDDLLERYGIRIPVVKLSDELEIDWPFGPADIEQLIQKREFQ